MKKTDLYILVAMTSTRPIYRNVFICDGHYFIKWNNKIINVDTDILEKNYIRKGVF